MARSTASRHATCHVASFASSYGLNRVARKNTTSRPAAQFLHIITDQVRFYRAGEREPMALAQVPPLAFSEIMRDVDLFVGVASVATIPLGRMAARVDASAPTGNAPASATSVRPPRRAGRRWRNSCRASPSPVAASFASASSW
jgi:hypothetical protein